MLTFTQVNNEYELLLELNHFHPDWKMSMAFPSLEDTVVDGFHYVNPTFKLDSQHREVLPDNFRELL